MNKVVILHVEDWLVVYVNGKEEYQGHSMRLGELSEHCPIESIKEDWVDDKVVAKTGRFPSTLDECMKLVNKE